MDIVTVHPLFQYIYREEHNSILFVQLVFTPDNYSDVMDVKESNIYFYAYISGRHYINSN